MPAESTLAYCIGAAIRTNLLALILFVLAIIFRKKNVVPWILAGVGFIIGALQCLMTMAGDSPDPRVFFISLLLFVINVAVTLISVISGRKRRDDDDDEDDDD